METINELSTEVPNEVPSIIKNLDEFIYKLTEMKNDIVKILNNTDGDKLNKIFTFGNETIQHIDVKRIADEIENISKDEIKNSDIYDCEENINGEDIGDFFEPIYNIDGKFPIKLIINFHKIIMEIPENNNYSCKNVSCVNINILTNIGLSVTTMKSFINYFIKVRAKQLLKYKEGINKLRKQHKYTFSEDNLINLWNSLEKISNGGMSSIRYERVKKYSDTIIRYTLANEEQPFDIIG